MTRWSRSIRVSVRRRSSSTLRGRCSFAAWPTPTHRSTTPGGEAGACWRRAPTPGWRSTNPFSHRWRNTQLFKSLLFACKRRVRGNVSISSNHLFLLSNTTKFSVVSASCFSFTRPNLDYLHTNSRFISILCSYTFPPGHEYSSVRSQIFHPPLYQFLFVRISIFI